MEPKKPALRSKSGSEKKSGPWRPTKRQVLWVIGMVVALLTTALLILNLHPEIWKGLLEERILTLIAIGVSVTAIIVLLAIGGAASSWTGFRGMTVRDWLDLLVVPLALVVISFLFTTQQDQRQQRTETQRAEAERELAEQRAQDEALQAYLDQMSQLMLERKLLEAEPGDPVHTLAQARTSTVILRLDAEHNESVSHFLINSGLAVRSEASPRLLSGIPLSHATLSNAYLAHADLRNAEMSDADMSGAYLFFARLRGANLARTNLKGASLFRADLRRANLFDADLSNAYVSGAHLSNANLRGADLSNAHVSGAHLSEANLRGADLSDANLSGVTDLSWAILNDAVLSGANLRDANLRGADLIGVDLSDANLSATNLIGADLSGAEGITNEELEQQALSLEGATMPNGQKYEDWLKDKEG